MRYLDGMLEGTMGRVLVLKKSANYRVTSLLKQLKKLKRLNYGYGARKTKTSSGSFTKQTHKQLKQTNTKTS